MLTPDLRVELASEAFYAAFGGRPETVVSRSIYTLAGGAWDTPALRRLLEEVLPEEGAFEGREVEHGAGQTGRRVLLLSGRRLAGAPRVLLAAHDVTERKAAEDALRASEECYRTLVKGALEYAILMLDPEYRITVWNAGAERIFGYTEAEAVGRPVAVLFTEEDRAAGVPEAEVATAIRLGHASDDRVLVRKDGVRFWASGMTEALRYPDGRLRGFSKVLRDNTPQKQAEDALRDLNETLEAHVEERAWAVREQEERFRRLVEASAQMVWTTNAEGLVVEDSPSWRAFTGQTLAEWRGEGWADAIHPDDRPRATASWRRSVAAGAPVDTEYRLWHAPSRTWRWTHVRAVPLRNDGAVRGWIGMSIDVDDRKRAEERVRELAARLTVAEQEERHRIARVLHDDLQQQLFGLGMTLGLLRGASSEEAVVLRDQAEEILGLAFDLTRSLATELSPPVLASPHLEDLLRWVALRKEEQQGLRVTVEARDRCEVPSRPLRVLLYRALDEALFNVVKHAGTMEARLRAWEEAGFTFVEVEDEGAGFDVGAAEAQARTGNGFGLADVRDRIEQTGGRIEVASTLGRGTRVTITLPATPPTPGEA